MKVVEVNVAVKSTTGEAHVVFKPINAAYFLLVTFALKIGRVFAGVKVVDVDVGRAERCSKHVSAVAELKLLALFGGYGLVFFDAVREDIHEENLVVECNNYVKSAWVERHSASFFACCALVADLEGFGCVIPNEDVPLRSRNN